MFPPSTRILIADDLKTIRSLLIEILRKLGFAHIDDAEDGKAAKDKLLAAAEKGQPYNLLITDWNMPGLTGLQLIELRNQEPKLKDMAILMITVESEREYVLKAITAGVNDFVVKPFSERTIDQKLKGIWDRLATKPNNL